MIFISCGNQPFIQIISSFIIVHGKLDYLDKTIYFRNIIASNISYHASKMGYNFILRFGLLRQKIR